MRIFPFVASQPNMELISSPDSFFDNVSKEYIQYRDSGFFIKDSEPCIFIYRINTLDQQYTGIIATNDIEDLEQNKILGHENTLAEKEQVMMTLMLSRKAMIKPALLTYSNSEILDNFIETYIQNNPIHLEIVFQSKEETHHIWKISNPNDIDTLINIFQNQIEKAFIADGHHRALITLKLIKKHYLNDNDNQGRPHFLCAYFPKDNLKVYEFNRIVDFSSLRSNARFIAHLSKYFDIKFIAKSKKPTSKFMLTLHIGREWYQLRWKKSVIKKANKNNLNLDVELFNTYVLKEIMHIKNIKTATEVTYVEGIKDIQFIQNTMSNPLTALFCFYPVDIEEVIDKSLNGLILPPKSTWFEPRMINGLFIKEF